VQLSGVAYPVARGSLYQGDKQPVVVLVVLRVPLDPDRKIMALNLDRLYRAVGGKANGLHPATELVDRLVMMAAALGFRAKYGGHGTAFVKGNPVGCHLARCRPVSIAGEHVRQVLVKRAAQTDIEHLEATTNG
jgi:hypothetical protein